MRDSGVRIPAEFPFVQAKLRPVCCDSVLGLSQQRSATIHSSIQNGHTGYLQLGKRVDKSIKIPKIFSLRTWPISDQSFEIGPKTKVFTAESINHDEIQVLLFWKLQKRLNFANHGMVESVPAVWTVEGNECLVALHSKHDIESPIIGRRVRRNADGSRMTKKSLKHESFFMKIV